MAFICAVHHTVCQAEQYSKVDVDIQIVQSQESDAAEMSEQIQQLEAERAHLQDVSKDLDLAESRVRPHAYLVQQLLLAEFQLLYLCTCLAVGLPAKAVAKPHIELPFAVQFESSSLDVFSIGSAGCLPVALLQHSFQVRHVGDQLNCTNAFCCASLWQRLIISCA